MLKNATLKNFLQPTILLMCVWLVHPPAVRATPANKDVGQSFDGPPMTLVFSDDFSTDPNSNGKWSVHRYADDSNGEAVWDTMAKTWHLTRPTVSRAAAVFANYELTATEWKAQFRYRVGKLGGDHNGGDGFVFMFYKDKNAYGQPEAGSSLGFEVYPDTAVQGYGVEFDNYYTLFCDPSENRHIALIHDVVCNELAFVDDERTGDNRWHTAQVKFISGLISIEIDGATVLWFQLAHPNLTFSGIGFGAATAVAVADHEIDDFRLWMAN